MAYQLNDEVVKRAWRNDCDRHRWMDCGVTEWEEVGRGVRIKCTCGGGAIIPPGALQIAAGQMDEERAAAFRPPRVYRKVEFTREALAIAARQDGRNVCRAIAAEIDAALDAQTERLMSNKTGPDWVAPAATVHASLKITTKADGTMSAAPAPTVCACGCGAPITPHPRWGGYADSAHMMRAARLRQRDEACGEPLGPPLKLMTETNPQVSRELDLVDQLELVRRDAGNRLGKLRDDMKKVLDALSPDQLAAYYDGRPVPPSRSAAAGPVVVETPWMPWPETLDRPVPCNASSLEVEEPTRSFVHKAPSFVAPGRVRPLPVMSGGPVPASPRPAVLYCQNDEDLWSYYREED